MKYQVTFTLDCTTAKPSEIKKELKYLMFPDIDDVVSWPQDIRVKQIKENNHGQKTNSL